MYPLSPTPLLVGLWRICICFLLFKIKFIICADTTSIPIYLSRGGLTISVLVGSDYHHLALSGRLEGVYLFSNQLPNCKNCYDPSKSPYAEWCNNPDQKCDPVLAKFECNLTKKLNYEWAVMVGPYAFDSLYYTPKIMQGYDIVELNTFSAYNGVDKRDFSFGGRTPIALITELEPNTDWPLFENVSGIFGLVGPSLCCRESSFWWNAIGEFGNIFKISIDGDFSYPKDFKKVGSLTLGNKGEEFVWSHPRHIGGLYSDAFMQFTVYNFKMCGVDLFGQTSGNWEAIMDPTCRCLGLPKNFWLSLMRYLPVKYEDCLYETNFPRVCKLRRGGNTKLPVLTFTLADDTKSPSLSIPLDSLLFKLNEDDPDDYLCIVPTDLSAVKKNGAVTTFPAIKFGYQVMRNFNIAIDQNDYKIGLSNKANFTGSDELCSTKVACMGDTVFIPPMNVCLAPECNIWLLKTYDVSTGTCKYNKWAFILLWISIALIGILDINSYFSYRRLVAYTKKLCK